MARPKRQAAVKGIKASEGSVSQRVRQKDVSAPSQDDQAAQTPLSDELQKRRHHANLEIWKNLGYPDTTVSAGKQRTVKAARGSMRKPDSCGELKEKYRIHNNPPSRRVLLLQFPDRDPRKLYSSESRQKPLEVRVKPRNGIVEVDIPLHVTHEYDKEKGIEFGSGLRRSQISANNGAYGLAGGLGVGSKGPSAKDEEAMTHGASRMELLENFDASLDQGFVMDRLTLGGRIIPFEDGDPIYMIATFAGSEFKPCTSGVLLILPKRHALGQNSML